ncbi:Putative LRR receptor-like serine/threonine-protein kinase [Glycine soja]|nr:Putative LRR receptor-like serine/threonine-protein kinase [Glycine soja]
MTAVSRSTRDMMKNIFTILLGVFQNSSELVVTGNSKLCGGISELHLPHAPSKQDFSQPSMVPRLSNTSIIVIKETVVYAPPEYGVGSEVSMKGNMYSFGILMLEMLIGRKLI